MRGRFACAALTLVLAIGAGNLELLGQAAPWAGAWKLNGARSKYSPGPAPRSTTLKITGVPNGYVVVNDTVDADGNAARTEINALFDGKEYTLKGAPQPTTRSYKRLDRGYEYVARINGNVTTTTRAVVSPDGKTLTITQTGMDLAGRKVNNLIVYERQ
jgi:hypothetical protein